jgi:Type II secretion system (T2SS), protein M subtype b
LLFAALQSRLRETSGKYGLQVYQSSNLPVEELKPGLSKVVVRLEIAGQASMVARFIDELESSEPNLFVDKFDLKSAEQEGVDAQYDVQLFVGIEVWGLVAKAIKP